MARRLPCWKSEHGLLIRGHIRTMIWTYTNLTEPVNNLTTFNIFIERHLTQEHVEEDLFKKRSVGASSESGVVEGIWYIP